MKQKKFKDIGTEDWRDVAKILHMLTVTKPGKSNDVIFNWRRDCGAESIFIFIKLN